ncbi:nitroreductase [Secundilactobacillus folii]|uniref:Nitroreductase n=1 Tax=Secundilactobacillus folii TaxID=2678357 RepID=A0A7X3C2V1_9LACO|nr:nitroreductase [Secundilactobacillus folii]MTV81842.1 nitroreductase [Secundilactobacillus folii]
MIDNSVQLKRRSARNFSDKPVDLEVLKQIISEATHAPSWENSQPWQIYLAVGETAKRLRQHHAEATKQQQKSWTEVMPPQDWAQKPKANIDQWVKSMSAFMGSEVKEFSSAGPQLFNAPALVYMTMPKESTSYSAYDIGALGYGILLAAEERGISGIPAYEFVRYPSEVRQEFEIPENEAIFMGIGLGYPTAKKMNTMQTTRNSIDDILQIRD